MYMSALPFGWLGIVYTDWTPICFGLIAYFQDSKYFILPSLLYLTEISYK